MAEAGRKVAFHAGHAWLRQAVKRTRRLALKLIAFSASGASLEMEKDRAYISRLYIGPSEWQEAGRHEREEEREKTFCLLHYKCSLCTHWPLPTTLPGHACY